MKVSCRHTERRICIMICFLSCWLCCVQRLCEISWEDTIKHCTFTSEEITVSLWGLDVFLLIKLQMISYSAHFIPINFCLFSSVKLQLQATSVGEVVIKGICANRYLAMNRDGRLFGAVSERDYQPSVNKSPEKSSNGFSWKGSKSFLHWTPTATFIKLA